MTKKIEDGGSAYPTARVTINGETAVEGVEAYGPGMSLRDWLAGQALAGLLAHSFDDGSDFLHDAGPDAAAYQAYRMADAMISARKSGGET